MFRGRSAWTRCINLVLLLDLLLFMTCGSAIALRTGYIRNSPITASELRISNSYAAPGAPASLKDSISQGTFHAAAGAIRGRNLVAKFLDVMIQPQFGYGANGSPALEEIDSRNRRLLRDPRGPGRPRPQQTWSSMEEQQGRRNLEGSNTTTTPASGQQTQPFYLGPPAPPGIVHNEKQDWNQDYAEPDVHPPSSN